LVFETNSSGQVDDIKIGATGDITPLDPTFSGLTFWDRGPANPTTGSTIIYCHNATGTAPFSDVATLGGCSGSWLDSNGSTYTVSGPSSFIWSTVATVPLQAVNKYQPARYLVGVGQGALLGMARADGITDGLNTIQGVRTYDSSAGAWTTPDDYAGNVDDPASQKSYMWNDDNPVAYSDPSGYITDPLNMGHDPETGLLVYDAVFGLNPTAIGAMNPGNLSSAPPQVNSCPSSAKSCNGFLVITTVQAPTAALVNQIADDRQVLRGWTLFLGFGMSFLGPEAGAAGETGETGALSLSRTVASHAASRPYVNSRFLAEEIMAAKAPIPDPGGIPGGLRWDVPGSFNGSFGAYQMVVDPATSQIVHFLFTSTP